MRWPFGPPRLTLKPSQNKKTKKQNQKNKKKKEKVKNTKNTQKNELFSYQSKVSCFWGGVQKFAFFDNLAQKARTQKNTITIGVSARHFWKKQLLRHETATFGQKNTNPEIPVIIFLPFSSLSTTENTKICRNPYFYSVLANLKKIIFNILD